MSMVCGLDLHRQQITFDALETESGEVWRGGGGGAPPPQVPPRLCPGGGPPARGGPGGVAGASAALQVAGRSTPRVDATYPRRTVPAWRGRARGGDPFGDDSGAADGRRGDLDPSRSPTGAGRLLDARGHRRRGAVLEAGPAALRSSPTGVPGAGGSQLRHRRVGRRGGVGRARRLPALLALGTGGAPQRVGRQRRLLRPASGPWLPDPAGATDVALGAVRSSDERIPPAQPGPRLLHDGERPPRRQARRHRRSPSARSTLLPRAAQPRSRRRLRDGGLTTACGPEHWAPRGP